MFEEEYYNQSEIWNQKPEYYQVQLLADILSLIPENTRSILDVGCGNGLITNNLPRHIDVVGFDSSEEALKNVRHQKKVGSITSLPFADNSFDMVMANDVIEHLNDDIYLHGVSELFRVASKYVLISVPHAEQLEKSLAKCSNCGYVYHINHHQRSFREQELINLCCIDWKVNEIRYSGDITRPPSDPIEMSTLHELQGYLKHNNSICPNCGSSTVVHNDSEKTQQILGNLRSKSFFNRESLINKHINRSEIISFYTYKEIDLIQDFHKSNLKEKLFSPLLLDLNNHLQEVENGFVEGCFWSKYLNKNKHSETFFGKDNINLNVTSLLIQFPIVSEVGDRILVTTESPKCHIQQIRITVHDDLNNIAFPINNISYLGDGKYELIVDKTWEVNSYGTAVSIEVDAEIGLQSIQYLSKNFSNIADMPFLFLNKGHNILVNSDLDYYRTWGLLVDSSAYYPKPDWLWSEKLNSFYDLNFSKITLLDYKKSVEKVLKQKDKDINHLLQLLEENSKKKELESARFIQEISYLSGLLEKKELERSQAEEAYAKVSSFLEKKELERSQAEEAYALASKFATFFFNNAKRRVSRILVLSHMFPNPSQLNSGCFVAEQVKALRENEGLDVRVVSCQPFWCNTKNPLKLKRAIDKYKELACLSQWSLYEGIPTLFIPYLVGKPYFPFHVHSFNYRYSIAQLANRIHHDFNFDLVHAHTGYLDGFSGTYLSNRYKVPLIITEHTGPFSFLTRKQIVRQITIKSLVSAKQIICVSSAMASEVQKYIPPTCHNKLICIPNGVDTTKFYPKQASEQLNSNDKLRLLSVISLDDNKNPFGLIEAVQILLKRQMKLDLTIVGGGELIEKLKQWTMEHELLEYIHIIGWQTRDEVARLMREHCDIFVLPSHSETFGVVVIEAMASGKPVVSTRCGGPEEIIRHSYLGELCEKDNPISLANAIAKVAKNLENYPKQKIRNFVLDNYGFKLIAQKLTELYQCL
ncbi:glycosyltransferase [Anabaena sp. CCY 9402-a]|uniref:glycosyltransferase n=1 Tax=Anabaena sp. CCY 9402-a TaxID=3103867 RepID=UPI0039C69B2B